MPRESAGPSAAAARPAATAAVIAAVADEMPWARAALAELVAFRSVADPERFPVAGCEAAAAWVADALRAAGFAEVALLDTPDGSRSVYGFLPGPPGSATVLLYAHYDVQPPLDEAGWDSPPFEMTERTDGRWYGRGTADCKGAVLMHLLALRALRATVGVPVNVKVIVEGSEEQGTGGLEQYARDHPELLRADTILIADTGNVRAGLPTVVSSLRGAVLARIEVRTLSGDLHSGQFGGAAPDALAALVRTLASLHDQAGATAVDGLSNLGCWEGSSYNEELFRRDAQILDGVSLVGTGEVADRLWAQPSVTIMGIDCPTVNGATPAVQARARAMVCLRIPPGAQARTAAELLTSHLRSHVPWGARVSVEVVGQGEPFTVDTSTPSYTAMARAMETAYGGERMRVAGLGGSIPLCSALAELYPQAEILLTGLGEPEARIHTLNESVDPRELSRMAAAEALFLLFNGES
ncbi:dipeptidase [Streptomyces sp. NPDC017260]|uniref:dipeptidase n=1 Tax=unclassified Streptomyces TaxID=2593676 RepID=UPI0037AF0034